MHPIKRLQRQYGISAKQAELLVLLVISEVVTAEEVEAQKLVSKVSAAKMALFRLRAKLKPHGVTIESQRDVGYWLTDAGRASVQKVLGSAPAAADSNQ